MKYSSRFFLYAPVGAFLLILIGLCVHWFWASGKMSDRLDAMNGQTVMPGVTLHFAQKEMAGFPFRLDAIFKDLEITVETTNGLARWRSENFAFHTLPFGRPQEVFEAAGKQTLSWTGDKGEAKSFEFIPGSLRASAIEDDTGALTRFDLDLLDLGSAALQAGRLQFHIRKDGDALQFVVDGNTIHLSSTSVYGDTIKSLRLEGHVTQATALDSLRRGQQEWRAALENWRKNNGIAELASGNLALNEIKIGGSGALALDDARRLKGQLKLKFTGKILAVSENLLEESQGEKKDEFSLTVSLKDGILFSGKKTGTTLEPLY